MIIWEQLDATFLNSSARESKYPSMHKRDSEAFKF